MTPTEMETLLQNLDARWARIEQILPTLATRSDVAAVRAELTGELNAVRDELTGQIDGVRADLTGHINAVRVELTEDIDASGQALRADVTEQISASANGLRVLIEASRDETRVVAEHLLDLMTRFPRQP